MRLLPFPSGMHRAAAAAITIAARALHPDATDTATHLFLGLCRTTEISLADAFDETT